MQTICGLFDHRADALAVIGDLEARGFAAGAMSVITHNQDGWYGEDSRAEADAEIGAGLGAVLGGGMGLLSGLGLVIIPGIGPVIAAGWLLATAAGIAAGAILGGATGGLVGALSEAGIRPEDAELFAEGLRRGGTLVLVKALPHQIVAVEAAMLRHCVDIAARRQEYAAQGWIRFDDTAGTPPTT